MADFNPLTSLPDPKDFVGSNPYGTTVMPGFFDATLKREQAAAPFIQMAQEAERMKIDKDRQMNPLLVEHQGLQNAGIRNTNDRFVQSTPFEVDRLRLGNIKSGLENDSLGMDNAVKGAGLAGSIKDVQEKDLNSARDRFASLAEELRSKPGVTKVTDYVNAAKAIASQITDPSHRAQFEAEFLAYPTKGMQSLQARAAQKYNTPAAQQARDTAKITGEYNVKAHQASAYGTIEAARIHANSSEKIKEMEQNQPKNAAVMVLNARKWLANPPPGATPEQFAERQGIVDGAEHSEAQKLYAGYQANYMSQIKDRETLGRAKDFNDFLEMVRKSYKQTGAQSSSRAGPTAENARNLNVGGSGVTSSGAKFTITSTP
jgi:hypothetical protein